MPFPNFPLPSEPPKKGIRARFSRWFRRKYENFWWTALILTVLVLIARTEENAPAKDGRGRS